MTRARSVRSVAASETSSLMKSRSGSSYTGRPTSSAEAARSGSCRKQNEEPGWAGEPQGLPWALRPEQQRTGRPAFCSEGVLMAVVLSGRVGRGRITPLHTPAWDGGLLRTFFREVHDVDKRFFAVHARVAAPGSPGRASSGVARRFISWAGRVR